MRGLILAHAGSPPAPHDLWSVWDPDPLVAALLVGLLWLHARGRRRSDRWRNAAFVAAVVAVAVALLTPVEPLSAALASAHMVQHVLLVVVAAPLFAFSAPGPALLRGAPVALRRVPAAVRRGTRWWSGRPRLPSSPVTVWLLHVVVLWTWHSATAYEAALASPVLHALEHAAFLGTAVLLWRVVVGRRVDAAGHGIGVLLVFGTAMQSALLSLLLTFATVPWYDAYADSTAAWGLTPLADQQLAGAIMWIPAGAIHVAVALALLAAWVRSSDAPARPSVSSAGRR